MYNVTNKYYFKCRAFLPAVTACKFKTSSKPLYRLTSLSSQPRQKIASARMSSFIHIQRHCTNKSYLIEPWILFELLLFAALPSSVSFLYFFVYFNDLKLFSSFSRMVCLFCCSQSALYFNFLSEFSLIYQQIPWK